MTPIAKRLKVVDALRGFSIVAIMLLHNLEHFDFYFKPTNLPNWMLKLDQSIWDTSFFLFGGKVYAIFALLFGLTFFIQYNNQALKGKDFRGRFAWRMLLLLAFGFINSAFYEGDILSIYAVIAFGLIPIAKLSNKWLLAIAIVLMAQPFEWFNFIKAVQNPDMQINDPISWAYFGKASNYIPEKSIINTWIGNLTNGKLAVIYWSWEQGRVFQTLSLFIFGLLAGRKSLFDISNNSKFWRNAFIVSIATYIPLYLINRNIGTWIGSPAILRPLSTIESSWLNMSFMVFLVSGFILLFQTKTGFKILDLFSPMGRMSLSNYIIQSIIGSFIYYGFGLSLYQYTGATYSLLIGIVLAVLQGILSAWWLKSHKYGPLEYLWHKATWIKI